MKKQALLNFLDRLVSTNNILECWSNAIDGHTELENTSKSSKTTQIL